MNRKYKEVLPVGYILAAGQRYLLLHPEPLDIHEPWSNGLLYFKVALSGEHLDWTTKDTGKVFTYSPKILVVHPQNFVMELGYIGDPLLVLTGEIEIVDYETDEQTSFADKLMFGLDPEEGEDNG